MPASTSLARTLCPETVTTAQHHGAHLVDRMHYVAQLSDRQCHAGRRVVRLVAAGEDGVARMLGGMPAEHAIALAGMCQERHPGFSGLSTLQAALSALADQWGIPDGPDGGEDVLAVGAGSA